MTRGKPALEIAGQRFGRLVALERDGVIGKGAAWRYLCDCGQVVRASASEVKRGRTRSCGCAPRGWTARNLMAPPAATEAPPIVRPAPCRTCAHWRPNPAAELRGECAVGAFLRGRPWSGQCSEQAAA